MKRHYLLHITPHEVIVSYVSHQLRTARFLVTQFMWELTQLAKEKAPSTAPMAVQFQYRSGQSVNLCCSSRDLSSVPPGWISDRPDNYNVTVRQLDRTEHKQLKWLMCKVNPEPWSCGWLVRYSYDFFAAQYVCERVILGYVITTLTCSELYTDITSAPCELIYSI